MKALAFIFVLTVAASVSAQEPDVVPVMKDKPAPFNGLLVPEGRMSELLEAEVKVKALTQDIQVQVKYANSLETMFNEQLKKATAPDPWWRDPRLHLTIGIIIGVATTALAVYGGAKIVEAGNGH